MNAIDKFSDIMNVNNLTKLFTDSVYFNEREIECILDSQAMVTEKIHGENFRFGMVDGVMHCGQRRRSFDELEKHHHFHKFAPSVMEDIEHLIQEFRGKDFIAFGELYGPGMQSGFNWRFNDGLRVIWFDLKVDGTYLEPEAAFDIFNYADVDMVPLIGYMTIREALKLDIENMKSIASDTDFIEGVVIRPLKYPAFWKIDTRLIIKYKTERFSEQKQRKKKMRTESDAPKFISDFVDFVTDARIEHAIQALEEDGKEIVYDMKDLRFLVQAVIVDIEKEENEGNPLPKDDRRFMGKFVPKFYSDFLRRRKENLLGEI